MLVQASLISSKITKEHFKISYDKPRYRYSTYIQLERLLLCQIYLHDLDKYTFYNAKRTSFPPVNF